MRRGLKRRKEQKQIVIKHKVETYTEHPTLLSNLGVNTAKPRINHVGACLLSIFACVPIRGCLNIFLVVGRIPVRTFLLVSCFFDATHTSKRMVFTGQANFR